MQLAFIQGVGVGASLIIAVGAQNAFVLKQGIMGQKMLPIALICALIDAVMITAGVAGFGRLIQSFPMVKDIASFAGAGFLIWYGYAALKSSMGAQGMELAVDRTAEPLKTAIIGTLAISLLNPHLYLDTVVLLGSISTQFDDSARPWFAAGAVLASFLWFFSLAYMSRKLAPIFKKPTSWMWLDRFIFVTMWAIAAAILAPYLSAASW
ncbi:LysE/ArgO family amino acid transporter [Paraferrimonas sp. SM1919]|uniref:LysE/ArgO family amino acid transporter n=1 Tax=Paraferrimonas sp. SM1919 TaxID=2662263 RepID=UPI0013D3E66D|nr:LysE/ArgO family amino acid transporter [Paraferrimonas sp. SM1919]